MIEIGFDDLPKEQYTKPFVFIIESLKNEERCHSLLDGELLYQQLQIAGLNPRYVYVTCLNDFKAALAMFRQSNYRFLHLSLHGSKEFISFEDESSDYLEFSQATAELLRSKRIFASACEVGNANMVNTLSQANHNFHSFLAPVDKLGFSDSVSFWPALYGALYKKITANYDANNGKSYKSLKTSDVKNVVGKLAALFDIRFLFAYFDSKNKSLRFQRNVLSKSRKGLSFENNVWDDIASQK